MWHLTRNYMLGLAVLIVASIVFYTPLVYAFLKIREQQRNQNKS